MQKLHTAHYLHQYIYKFGLQEHDDVSTKYSITFTKNEKTALLMLCWESKFLVAIKKEMERRPIQVDDISGMLLHRVGLFGDL